MYDLEETIRQRHSTRMFLPDPVPRHLIEESLELAVRADYPLARAVSIAYASAFAAERDAREAAMAFGYAKARLSALEWTPERDDELALDSAARLIQSGLGGDEFTALQRRGAEMDEGQALSLLSSSLSTLPETSSYAGPRS